MSELFSTELLVAGMKFVIDAVQLASVVFESVVPWTSDAFDSIKDLDKFRLSFDGDNFTVLFLMCTISVLVFFLLPVVGMCVDLDCCAGPIEEYVWGYFGELVLFGILLIPVTHTIAEIFHCPDDKVFRNPDIDCWEGVHVVYVIMAVVCLILIVVGGVVKAGLMDQKSHDIKNGARYRRGVKFVDSKYSALRIVMVILSMVLVSSDSSGRVGAAVTLTIVGLLPFSYYIALLPHVRMGFNFLKCALYMGVWWVFVSSTVATSVDDSGDGASGDLLAATPAFFVLGFVLCVLRVKLIALPEDASEVVTNSSTRWAAVAVKCSPNLKLTPSLVELPAYDDVELGGVAVAVPIAQGGGQVPLAGAPGAQQRIVAPLSIGQGGGGGGMPRLGVELLAVVRGDDGVGELLRVLREACDSEGGANPMEPVLKLVVEGNDKVVLANQVSSGAFNDLIAMVTSRAMPYLHSFGLVDHMLPGAAAKQLARALQGVPRVRDLQLTKNALKEDDVKGVVEILLRLPSVRHVDLSRNAVSAAGQGVMQRMVVDAGRSDFKLQL